MGAVDGAGTKGKRGRFNGKKDDASVHTERPKDCCLVKSSFVLTEVKY